MDKIQTFNENIMAKIQGFQVQFMDKIQTFLQNLCGIVLFA